jgi:predicted peptidase
MRVSSLIAGIIMLLSIGNLSAQRIAVTKQTSYPFLIDLPSPEILEQKPPVVVFLHGRSLSGGDLSRVQRYGLLYSMDLGRISLPAIVVAPHSRGGWNPDKLIEVIDFVVENYCADPDRVYVCGMSMGAYGTLDLAGKYPDRIAAAVAICGGGSERYACGLTRVPVWIQHGTGDRIVPASESKKIAGAIKSCDDSADVILTLIDGGTHGSVERLFHQYDMYNWMFRFRKQAGITLADSESPLSGGR